MIVLDPPGTLLRAAGLCFLAGFLWAALAAGGVFLGATRFRPRIALGRVWAEWRRRPVLWIAAPLAGLALALLTTEQIIRNVALRDLYWLNRVADMDLALICRLGALCGYLLALLAVVLFGLVQKRRNRAAGASQE